MGNIPALKPNEVIAILIKLGFTSSKRGELTR
jgi:predicted RNA binding protein YcfA (HicA-like mRNA interferase family)